MAATGAYIPLLIYLGAMIERGPQMAKAWTPSSWRGRSIRQVPEYSDAAALTDVENQLSTYPPLVFAGEARRLKDGLAKVAEGRAEGGAVVKARGWVAGGVHHELG